VRRATRRDLDDIGRLWMELVAYHAHRDPRFRARPNALDAYLGFLRSHVLNGRDSIVFVAERNGEVSGFLAARVENAGPIYEISEFGYICDLCVAESARRLGVGRSLVKAAIEWFGARGVSNVRISVAARNPDALEFWRKLGFQPFMERWWLDVGRTGDDDSQP
jgi:ribosomal protein S18 acetylase RimI-like enzyme